ncbi:MAG TPA: hypothetical protein VN088_16555 [Nocardioides sp.]|nr:hypothetical protein [Nocardioides sp.]
MGSESADIVGMDVTGLHSTGQTIAGRSDTAGSHAARVRDGVQGGAAAAGHPTVKRALSNLLTEHVIDPAAKLPGLLDATGRGIANVAATGRDEDNTRGGSVAGHAGAVEGTASALSARINAPS